MTKTEPLVKFHLSLNVTNLLRAVEFYRTFFGIAPAKLHDDYAKFELDDPPVIFSLVPHPPGPGCSLSHLGLRVTDEATVHQFRDRLEAAGICTQAQEGTVCGYARQNKCWIKDPDGNFWEICNVEEDLPSMNPRAAVACGTAVDPRNGETGCADATARQDRNSNPHDANPNPHAGALAVWEHYVTNPFPERIPHDDGSLDEVRLTGTFNASLSGDQLRQLLDESRRALKPRGKIVTHGLMGDRPFRGAAPKLPGLAAMVSRLPLQNEPIEMFQAAGFVGIQMVKYTEKPWFTHDGVELREVKIIAWKPAAATATETRQVLYKGPFAQARADGGQVFPRGQRISVPLEVCNQLRLGPAAESFLFLDFSDGEICQAR